MQIHTVNATKFAKAVGVGTGVSVLPAAFMLAALQVGLSPVPKPLSLDTLDGGAGDDTFDPADFASALTRFTIVERTIREGMDVR